MILENTRGTVDQVNHFKYLGYDVTYLEETDADVKTENFLSIYRTDRRTLKEEFEKTHR
jgi:hypothetical protein